MLYAHIQHHISLHVYAYIVLAPEIGYKTTAKNEDDSIQKANVGRMDQEKSKFEQRDMQLTTNSTVLGPVTVDMIQTSVPRGPTNCCQIGI